MPNWRECTGSSIIQVKLYLGPYARLLSFVSSNACLRCKRATHCNRTATLSCVQCYKQEMSNFVASCHLYCFDYNSYCCIVISNTCNFVASLACILDSILAFCLHCKQMTHRVLCAVMRKRRESFVVFCTRNVYSFDYNRCNQVLLRRNLCMHVMWIALYYLQYIVLLIYMALIITGAIKYSFVAIPACMPF